MRTVEHITYPLSTTCVKIAEFALPPPARRRSPQHSGPSRWGSSTSYFVGTKFYEAQMNMHRLAKELGYELTKCPAHPTQHRPPNPHPQNGSLITPTHASCFHDGPGRRYALSMVREGETKSQNHQRVGQRQLKFRVRRPPTSTHRQSVPERTPLRGRTAVDTTGTPGSRSGPTSAAAVSASVPRIRPPHRS